MTSPRAGAPAELQRAVLQHYEGQLARFGPTARGMDWKDEASQRLRFAVLCEVCELQGRSLHDVGAGAGHLCDFLGERGQSVSYTGSDLSEAMVESARRLHPGVRFERRDVLLEPPAERWDVVLCSGLFFVKLETDEAQWRAFVQAMLRRMFEMCRVAIAFNLMSDRVDWRTPDLYHPGAGEILDFCRAELSPSVVLRHDYPLHEYSVYVYRNPVLPAQALRD